MLITLVQMHLPFRLGTMTSLQSPISTPHLHTPITSPLKRFTITLHYGPLHFSTMTCPRVFMDWISVNTRNRTCFKYGPQNERRKFSALRLLLEWITECKFSMLSFYLFFCAKNDQEVCRSRPPMVKTLKSIRNLVLFDGENIQNCFPEASLSYITCNQSPWMIIFATMELQREYRNRLENGEKIRPVRFFTEENANHFVSCPIFLCQLVLIGM